MPQVHLTPQYTIFYRFCALGSRAETQDNGLREDSEADGGTASVAWVQLDWLTTLSAALSLAATASVATMCIFALHLLIVFWHLHYIIIIHGEAAPGKQINNFYVRQTKQSRLSCCRPASIASFTCKWQLGCFYGPEIVPFCTDARRN